MWGCRGRKRTPESFYLSTIRAKSLKVRGTLSKIYENVRKISELPGKLPENTDKNDARCFGAQRWEKHMKTFLYDLCGRKYSLKEFRASLRKLGQKYLALPNICLLLHLCFKHTHTHARTHHNLFENQTVK